VEVSHIFNHEVTYLIVNTHLLSKKVLKKKKLLVELEKVVTDARVSQQRYLSLQSLFFIEIGECVFDIFFFSSELGQYLF